MFREKEERKWIHGITTKMGLLKQTIAKGVFIMRYILLVEKLMKFAMFGEEMDVIQEVIEKRLRRDFAGQTQIGGIKINKKTAF